MFLYADSFLFSAKTVKRLHCEFHQTTACMGDIRSCRPNNPLVTSSSVSDLIISNVHRKD